MQARISKPLHDDALPVPHPLPFGVKELRDSVTGPRLLKTASLEEKRQAVDDFVMLFSHVWPSIGLTYVPQSQTRPDNSYRKQHQIPRDGSLMQCRRISWHGAMCNKGGCRTLLPIMTMAHLTHASIESECVSKTCCSPECTAASRTIHVAAGKEKKRLGLPSGTVFEDDLSTVIAACF